jgi:hypothetical protein
MRLYRSLFLISIVCLNACTTEDSNESSMGEPGRASNDASAETCQVLESGMPLPGEVRETSGLARSGRDAALFWTHNDAGNKPELFAIDARGSLVQRVRVTGARLIDWEDIETTRCGNGACLVIADIGDNDGNRSSITVYKVPEPAAGTGQTAAVEAFHARYPDGPKDAEAMFADRAGTLYVITKGRSEPITLYRWPATSNAGSTVTLERVRVLLPAPRSDDDRVTGATSTPDGRWVGVRSYRAVYLYRAADLLSGGTAAPVRVDLSMLPEKQSESIVLNDDGTMWVSGEAANRGGRASWSRLRCTLAGPAPPV